MSDIDKMTRMSQQAMQNAAERAERERNPTVEPWHLLFEILTQEGGIVPQVIRSGMKLGLDGLVKEIENQIEHLPKVSGAELRVEASSDLVRIFKGAEQLAKKMGDEYISTEHFLLAALATGTAS
ncbi:MAG: type VI secretion system ATPase TssH, partial [Bdellovibrionales bacterium]|nr:type VI secretion system ATPase TssH [Bdellovibrionales bacterium]